MRRHQGLQEVLHDGFAKKEPMTCDAAVKRGSSGVDRSRLPHLLILED